MQNWVLLTVTCVHLLSCILSDEERHLLCHACIFILIKMMIIQGQTELSTFSTDTFPGKGLSVQKMLRCAIASCSGGGKSVLKNLSFAVDT